MSLHFVSILSVLAQRTEGRRYLYRERKKGQGKEREEGRAGEEGVERRKEVVERGNLWGRKGRDCAITIKNATYSCRNRENAENTIEWGIKADPQAQYPLIKLLKIEYCKTLGREIL